MLLQSNTGMPGEADISKEEDKGVVAPSLILTFYVLTFSYFETQTVRTNSVLTFRSDIFLFCNSDCWDQFCSDIFRSDIFLFGNSDC